MAGWVVTELMARHFDRPSLGRRTVAPFENEVDLITLLMAIREGMASLTDKIEDADNNKRLPSWPDEAVEMLLAEFLDCNPISRSFFEQVGGNGCASVYQSPMQPAVANIERFVNVIPPRSVLKREWQKEVSAKVGRQKIACVCLRHAKNRVTNASPPVRRLGKGTPTVKRLLMTKTELR